MNKKVISSQFDTTILVELSVNIIAILVGLSAHAMVDKREHSEEVGMNDYLAKPVKILELNGVFEKYGFKKNKPTRHSDQTPRH